VAGPPPLSPEDLTADRLAAIFDAPRPFTVGLEEEVMLLDRATLDLAPVATDALARLDGDERFKAELPASQLEIVTAPAASAAHAIEALAAGRRDLVDKLDGLARPAAAGVHPFADPIGELNDAPRYRRLEEEYGLIARCQLVTSLQVHVAVGHADRTLVVYNTLRERLPEIAALGANAAYYCGRDAGFSSVRPKIAELLPRQGLPPPLRSWDEFAAELRWGARAGAVTEPRTWWWELRPNPAFGTLEVRAPDAQTTLADAAAIAAVVQALAAHLAEGGVDGEEPAPAWRIEENRWSAARHGIEGEMVHLATGEPEPTRNRLSSLLDELEPVAEGLGSGAMLGEARRLAEVNGAIRQRQLAGELGIEGLVAWLADHFLDGADQSPVFRSVAAG
jgi:carboxylate-amine ligase